MTDAWILRYGELSLKGKNRILFEERLIRNIKSFLNKNKLKFDSVLRLRGRIIVFSTDDLSRLTQIFGLVSISKAKEIELDIKKIEQEIKKSLLKKDFESFRVTVQRIDKRIQFKSIELERDLGSFVVEQFNKKVSLKEFDLQVSLELFNDKAYLFFDKIKAVGGLPVGCSGKVLSIIENKDDVDATLLMMKRGCDVVLVVKKKLDLIKLDDHYHTELKIVEFVDDIDKLVKDNKCEAIVSGQRLDNFEEIKSDFLVFRPLMGFIKQ